MSRSVPRLYMVGFVVQICPPHRLLRRIARRRVIHSGGLVAESEVQMTRGATHRKSRALAKYEPERAQIGAEGINVASRSISRDFKSTASTCHQKAEL
ncbi:hypothetical protein PAXRUDRAFT_567124 [Paxillus rubicundulus Ve08.2h10]|uniref:Uncharacterized protein n=1 Tax=Paxillus rubicundulus Ve08.2h10 TaxID=930991 RepID=A0A0D0D6T3_9AGAM|nr:hypothetical protein PAXRUDRAFT_567124 [Paxillus rubicundulus Ve08.2h10]